MNGNLAFAAAELKRLKRPIILGDIAGIGCGELPREIVFE
jgi:hypothetical protein